MNQNKYYMFKVNLIPILFSTMMVQAILRLLKPKIVTRRTRGLEEYNVAPDDFSLAPRDVPSGFQAFRNNPRFGVDHWDYWDDVKCPYGKPGDIM